MRRTRRRTLKGAHSTKLSNLLNLKTRRKHCETKWERLYAHCSRHTHIHTNISPIQFHTVVRFVYVYLLCASAYALCAATQHYIPPFITSFHQWAFIFIQLFVCACTYRVDFMLCTFPVITPHAEKKKTKSPATVITCGQFQRTFNLKYLYELNAI